MNAFYAIYHGPEGLRNKANHAHHHTLVLSEGLKKAFHEVLNQQFFDTIKIKPAMISIDEIRKRAEAKKINLRYFEDNIHVRDFLTFNTSEQNSNFILKLYTLFRLEFL